MAAMTEQVLYVMSSARAYLAHPLGLMAYHDRLLRGTHHDDRAVDAREVLALLLKLFRDDSRHVWKLFARGVQNFFAHNLGYDVSDRLIRQLVFPEDGLALRQPFNHLFEQPLQLVALQGRERHGRAPVVLAGIPLHERQETGLIL